MMKRIKRKTRNCTKKSWSKKYDDAPLPLEAFGYPIRHKAEIRRIKKQKQDDYFKNQIYDKLIVVEFKDGNELNTEKFFYMPKLKPDWNLSQHKNALAIYPVLCGRADFRDDTRWVRISRENIGKLAGISPPSVDKGITALMDMKFRVVNEKETNSTPLLQRRKWQDGKRRGHEYLPGFFRYDVQGMDPLQWRTQYFIFHTCIVDNGVWSKMSRKAKALYWAMRSKAFFDQQAYEHIEGIYIPNSDELYEDPELYSCDGEHEKSKFRNRKWDVCNTSLKELFKLAMIPYADTRPLVDELSEMGLVERVHETKSVFKVFLRPKQLLND